MAFNITYIGSGFGTSFQRAQALERLGYRVDIIDPWSWLSGNRWKGKWLFYTGGVGSNIIINKHLYHRVMSACPDLIWVNQCEFLDAQCINSLRLLGVPIVNYLNDDPFGKRDKRRFKNFLKAIPFYDLLLFVREVNVMEAKQHGARQAIRVWMSADEIAHSPRVLTFSEQQTFASEVAFMGTWMPERGPFMVELIKRGIPLSIWGNRWQKAPEWPILKPYWRGPGLEDPKLYSAAILAAKICLGLLSKGNRDLHTTRSIEIPALGGLLCAERTSEHEALYEEGREAVFWNDAAECAEICRELLIDEKKRKDIAQRGRERAIKNNLFNEPVLASIIDTVIDNHNGHDFRNE